MTQKDRRPGPHRRIAVVAAAAVAALAATAGCGGPGFGGTDPKSVVERAQSLAQETLEAVRPTIGSATASVDSSRWSKCSTETPGVHRFSYAYVLKVNVRKDASQPVMDAAKAYFAKAGYRLDIPDPRMARVGGALPKSHWWVGVGVQDKSFMFISIDSGCVFTSSDPKV
ncbi:hypothetical protein [Streptomyces sp. NPDC001250]|uniref:hypothetical protein n=1 Tax=unclassified Streptomyces TaxID=2593676 RepID=UPI00331E0995